MIKTIIFECSDVSWDNSLQSKYLVDLVSKSLKFIRREPNIVQLKGLGIDVEKIIPTIFSWYPPPIYNWNNYRNEGIFFIGKFSHINRLTWLKQINKHNLNKCILKLYQHLDGTLPDINYDDDFLINDTPLSFEKYCN